MFTRHRTLMQLQKLAERARANGDDELSNAIAAAIIRVRRSEEPERQEVDRG